MPLLVNARGFNYKGSGDLKQKMFLTFTAIPMLHLSIFITEASPTYSIKKLMPTWLPASTPNRLPLLFRKQPAHQPFTGSV
jgi:hypothetical protein